MSRSTRQKKLARNTVARSKRAYPTPKKAMRSLELSGFKPHQLVNTRHTGTYWMWEVAR
jgi:hemin uptake protein HemP